MRFHIKNRKKEVHHVYIDDDDLPLIINYRWYAHKAGKIIYAASRSSHKFIYMHRLLMPENKIVDHINGNGLDNRRTNLQYVTQSQNLIKQPPLKGRIYKGVSLSKRKISKPWRAYISGKHLGYFETEEEAGMAYEQAAYQIFKDNNIQYKERNKK